MSGPAAAAGDLSAHTPMMAKYKGVPFCAFARRVVETWHLDAVPSWSPRRRAG